MENLTYLFEAAAEWLNKLGIAVHPRLLVTAAVELLSVKAALHTLMFFPLKINVIL